MNNWRVDLRDAELFGNEMAEDEEERLFESYAYERPEFSAFLAPNEKIKVVRAYKGEGKSALLRWICLKLRLVNNVIAHSAYANSIAPVVTGGEQDSLRGWKNEFIRIAARAFGSTLKFSFSDDVVSLREEAERGGFSQRGFVQAVLSRLKGLPASIGAPGAIDPEAALRRVAGANDVQVWLVIDDIDENFRNTEADCEKVMSALVAMRQLANQVPELRFRTSIRPSTWAIIKRRYEALSKIEPYVVDLQWTHEQLQDLLAARIKSYLKRNSGPAVSGGKISYLNARQLIAVAFDDPMPWGRKEVERGLADEKDIVDKQRSPSAVISSLARYRPRWMIELCKLGAKRAVFHRDERIGLDDLTENLHEFGRKRIDDIIAEFRAQCEKVELVIQSFKGKPNRFQTDELVKHVRSNLSGRDVRVAGVSGAPTEAELIRFLFQIGFLTARRDFRDGSYVHYSFYDEPALLTSGTNDSGVSWEVPSCYRQALQLRPDGRRMPR